MVKSLLVFLVFITALTACSSSDIDPFDDAIQTFLNQNHQGYDYEMKQTLSGEVTNHVMVEKRVDNREELKAYLWIQQQQLLPLEETLYQNTESIYYFQNPNKLIVDDGYELTTSNITYDEFIKLNQLPTIHLSETYLKDYKISDDDVMILTAKINPNKVCQMLQIDHTDMREATLSVKIQDETLLNLELILIQPLSKITITIETHLGSDDVIMPSLD